MNAEPFDAARLPDLMRWFPDAASVGLWGGPHFRHPFDIASFRQDACIDRLATWMLCDEARRLCAFGQYYARLGRCHLGRLAVAPEARGQGVGTSLIRQLCRRGAAALGSEEFSLFVLARNERAATLYRRLGFEVTIYPAPAPVPEGDAMLYMVAAGDAARALRATHPNGTGTLGGA